MEWPSQVARSPVSGPRAQTEMGSTKGSGARGFLPSLGQKKSRHGIGALSCASDSFSWTFPNPASSHRGDACIRARRSPVAFLPRDFTPKSPMRLLRTSSCPWRLPHSGTTCLNSSKKFWTRMYVA